MILKRCRWSKATLVVSAGVIYLACILVARVKVDRQDDRIGGVIFSSFSTNWTASGANEDAPKGYQTSTQHTGFAEYLKDFDMDRNLIPLLASLSVLSVSFAGCTQAEQRPIDYRIPIKVAIIYNLGGSQAVAREDFYLLTKNAVQIWKENGLLNNEKMRIGR